MDIKKEMLIIGQRARKAALKLALCDAQIKNQALYNIASEIKSAKAAILQANAQDISYAREQGRSNAIIDRLFLDEGRIDALADAVSAIGRQHDPVGEIIASWQRPNGLVIKRVRTPLGVIGIIYESRPGVTAEAAALALRAGNAVILRGGSDAFFSCCAIYNAMKKALALSELDPYAVQFVAMKDRSAVGEMLSGLDNNIDVIVPRGGKSLVKRVQQEARIPVFAHLEGICHIYVDKSADLNKACSIIYNAKMRRTAICGAAETLLFDRACSPDFISQVLDKLKEGGCELRASLDICQFYSAATLAREDDFGKEFLDAIIAVKLVDGVMGAINHIKTYSSNHTEAVIAEDAQVAEQFFYNLDSAILLHNASTQFADGGEFGFGAEIGIATGKFHARGPIGAEQLTSFKYHVFGNGQIRF